MKKFTLLFAFFAMTAVAFAQTDGLSYQAVILDPKAQELPGQDVTNNLLRNTPVTLRFTIIQGDGTTVYRETQDTQTDRFGMINLIIGQGNPIQGIFTEIDWNGVPKNLQVDISLDGTFKLLNKERLTYIPYAFHRNITATGTLRVDGSVLFGNDLVVNGNTILNSDLSVNNGSSTYLSGRLGVEGTTTLNNSLTVTNDSPTKLTGTLDVNGATQLNNSLVVEEATQLNSTLIVEGTTRLQDSLIVANESSTTLTGRLTVNGIADFNSEVNINNGSPLNVSGDLNVDGMTTLNDDLTVNGDTNLNSLLNVNNNSPSNLSGTLDVTGVTTLGNSLQVIGITNLENLLNVNNQSPANLSGSLTVDLETNLNSSLAVNNGAPTFLSGTLNVLGPITLNNNLTVNGITNLNNSLFVNNGSSTNLSGDLNVTGATDMDNTLIVDGATTLNSDLTVANGSPSLLTGTLEVDLPTNLNNTLDVTNGSASNFSGTLMVDGITSLNNNLEVTNMSTTYLSGALNVDGITNLNNALIVTNASPTSFSGTLDVDGVTSLRGGLIVDNLSPTNLSGELIVDGETYLNNAVNITGLTTINNNLNVTGVSTLGTLTTTDLNIVGDTGEYVSTFVNTNNGTGDGILIKLGKDADLPVAIDNPLLGRFSTGITLMKQLLANGTDVGVNEILTLLGDAGIAQFQQATLFYVQDFIFQQINDTFLPGGSPLDLLPITFPDVVLVPGFHIFGPITIPIIDVTIPSIDFPEINLANVPDLFGGITNFIPILNAPGSGAVTPLALPNFPSFAPNPALLYKDNVYVSFQDKNDNVTGEIRAQSTNDFYVDTLCDEVYLLNVAAGFIGIDLLDGLVSGATELTNLIDKYNKIGVEYTSGNGDYAEWLERVDPLEYLSSGDIVAVKGGKITKDLSEVEQIMVVSHRPIILGNIPEKGKENLGNNVAFMGQVPVKVMGPVYSGDFIVAHPELSGYGMAISPRDMTPENFVLSVGRSWEQNTNQGPKIINTVVGVHNGDWANIVKKLEQKQRSYEAKFKLIEAQVNTLEKKADELITNSNE